MFVDETGALWLSNPWIAVMLLAAAVGLVYWCHRWLESGKAPLPRRTVAQLRDGALRGRTIRQRQAIRPSVVTVARFASADSPSLRMVRSAGAPRSAA
ncbi:MAG TPA: hypothetical protein VFH48_09805 [Chloroflexota bacterium]|nr:hypothetical protein [Chloroflexota bacterium]